MNIQNISLLFLWVIACLKVGENGVVVPTKGVFINLDAGSGKSVKTIKWLSHPTTGSSLH